MKQNCEFTTIKFLRDKVWAFFLCSPNEKKFSGNFSEEIKLTIRKNISHWLKALISKDLEAIGNREEKLWAAQEAYDEN